MEGGAEAKTEVKDEKKVRTNDPLALMLDRIF